MSAPEESSLLQKCGIIASAVRGASVFPAPVLEMLGCSMEDSLGVAKDKRHPFQDEVTNMVGEVLIAMESQLEQQASALEAKLADADTVKATRAAAQQAADEELGKKEAALAQAHDDAIKAAEALTTAEEALAAAEAAVTAGEGDLELAFAKKARLQATVDQCFVPLKEGTVEPAKAGECAALVLAAGQECSFDPTLLDTVPAAFAKAPGMRGSFDGLIFQQVEEALHGRIAALGDEIANAEPAKQERAERAAAAGAGVEAAKSAKEASVAALEAAKAERREGLAAAKAAAKAVQQFAPELRQAGAELQRAKADLDAFRHGPLVTYRELLERTEEVEVPGCEAPLAAEAAPEKAEEAAPEPETAPAE